MHPLHALTRTMGVCASDRLRPRACRAHTCPCAHPACISTGSDVGDPRPNAGPGMYEHSVGRPGPRSLAPDGCCVLAPAAGSWGPHEPAGTGGSRAVKGWRQREQPGAELCHPLSWRHLSLRLASRRVGGCHLLLQPVSPPRGACSSPLPRARATKAAAVLPRAGPRFTERSLCDPGQMTQLL